MSLSYLANSNSSHILHSISDTGFEIPDKFVVGYALDYNEYFRDLNVSFAWKVYLVLAFLLPVVQLFINHSCLECIKSDIYCDNFT